MDRDISRRAHAVLMGALEIDDSPGRCGFVDESCAGDAALRKRVMELLRAVNESGDFLEVPALRTGEIAGGGGGGNALDEAKLPDRIGKYRILRVLGEGGMATVYEAAQENPTRRVALKVLRRGLRDASSALRFRFETEVLARLQHPGIAQIYEAGVGDIGGSGGGAGVPFFAMEYIEDALPITVYLDRSGADIRSRLLLFASVCDAVHHGHQRGVIHRDLKPGNILVDGSGRAKVIDFGIARPSDPGEAGVTSRADAGQLLGTLNYVSPEQCDADAGSLDVRTDVYSLGVVLYEALCGRLPHDLSRLPITGALRVIREGEPARPGVVRPALRGELEFIILLALEKDRVRRYAGAGELAADIRRYLRHEPVHARPATALYRASKFVRRNPALTAAAAIALIACVAGTAVSMHQARSAGRARAAAEAAGIQERSQRIIAERRGAELEQVAKFQAGQLTGVDAQAMGQDIRDRILAAAHDAQATEPHLSGVNFTDIAIRTLEAHVLERALLAARRDFADQPLVRARLMESVADSLVHLGLADIALAPQEEALEIRRNVLGNDDPATLDSISALGFVLERLGRRTEAEALHTEALRGRRLLLGEEHPATLDSIARLGSVLHRQGRWDEAEPYFRAALEGRRRSDGDNSASTLTAMNNMGVFLQSQGRWAEAEPYVAGALAGFRRVLGDDDPLTVASIGSLGELLQVLGRFAEAEALLRECLERRRRVLGDRHPDTLRAMTNCALLLRETLRLREAEPLLRESLEIRRRTLGNDHPDTLMSVMNMGAHLWSMREFDAALLLYTEALEGRRRALGEKHRSTLFTMASMGVLMSDVGRREEAEAYQRAALEGRRSALGEDHPDTLVSFGNMSSLMLKMGRAEEAEAFGREAVNRARRTLPVGHKHTARYISHHGAALVALGRFSEAEPLRLESYEINRSVFGEADSRTVLSAEMLAEFYEAWDRAEPGRGHAARAQPWREIVRASPVAGDDRPPE